MPTSTTPRAADPPELTIRAGEPSELILVDVPMTFEAVGIWKGRIRGSAAGGRGSAQAQAGPIGAARFFGNAHRWHVIRILRSTGARNRALAGRIVRERARAEMIRAADRALIADNVPGMRISASGPRRGPRSVGRPGPRDRSARRCDLRLIRTQRPVQLQRMLAEPAPPRDVIRADRGNQLPERRPVPEDPQM